MGESTSGARFELAWPCATLARTAPGDLPSCQDNHDGTNRPKTDGSPPPERSSVALEGARILVVEDDSAVVDFLDLALTARGAEVLSIQHRDELRTALSTGKFDAALFDISPIEEDVLGALRDARSSSEDLRVVLISGSSGALPYLPDGWVSAWVRKPFELSEVVAVLTAMGPRHAKAGRH